MIQNLELKIFCQSGSQDTCSASARNPKNSTDAISTIYRIESNGGGRVHSFIVSCIEN